LPLSWTPSIVGEKRLYSTCSVILSHFCGMSLYRVSMNIVCAVANNVDYFVVKTANTRAVLSQGPPRDAPNI